MKLLAISAVTLFASVWLNGCGGSLAPQRPSDAIPPLISSRVPAIVHPDRRQSWIAPDAAPSSQLLFVSDPGTASVDIFSLPDFSLKRKLSNYEGPLGECADRNGNIWVAQYLGSVIEYSHGGKVLNTIVVPRGRPLSCAVSPVNGAIAVVVSPNDRPGRILRYSNPSAAPAILRNPVGFGYTAAAYDSNGDLWIDGFDNLGHALVSRCGASRCTTVNLTGGSIFSAGSMLWDSVHNNWIIFDLYCHDTPSTCSYPVSESGAVGTPTTYMSASGGALCYLPQAALATNARRTSIIGVDEEYSCGYEASSAANRWLYPAGGLPAKSIGNVFVEPYGVAISRR
ncbi:MAG: hypothetical protein JOZ77_08915 [Candidatus Eremiobacteraeota bacterium]|nr:hypothetical protein [Candidatus Eremiobacteraeota bacterium]